MKINTEKILNNLIKQAEENPLLAIGVTTAFMHATAKVIDASGHRAGSRAYARQVDAKIKGGKR
jgi:hypothetical protein